MGERNHGQHGGECEPEKGGQQSERPVHRLEQIVEDERNRDIEEHRKHFGRAADPIQPFRSQDVVRGRRGVARHDKFAANIGFGEIAKNDDREVAEATDPRLQSRRHVLHD